MPNIDQRAVRDCIKSFLQTKGLSYQDLADRLNLKIQTVNNYMSTKPISPKTLGKIAKALDYPEELLLRGERYYGPDAYAELEKRVQELERIVFGKKC